MSAGLSYEVAIELVKVWLAWYILPPLFDDYPPVLYTRKRGKSGDHNGHQDHVLHTDSGHTRVNWGKSKDEEISKSLEDCA